MNNNNQKKQTMNTVGIVNLKHFKQRDFQTYFGHLPKLAEFCVMWQADGASYLAYLSNEKADLPSGATADTFKQVMMFYKHLYTDGDQVFHLLTPYELTQLKPPSVVKSPPVVHQDRESSSNQKE